jgi:N6-adenosine-specific RNA methylase IME4
VSDPFANLPKGQAGAIYADPPWRFAVWGRRSSRDPERHYPTHETDLVEQLPVGDLAAPNCCLFMWFSWPMLPDALRLIEAWGFEYKTCAFSWMKADVSTIDLFPDPKDADMQLGYWTRANNESCLLAVRGAPKRVHADVRMGIIEKARQHSRKPTCVYDRIERLVPGPYIELFARNTRPGWHSWGNQVGKFGEVA